MYRHAGTTSRALAASIVVVAVVALNHGWGAQAAIVPTITMGTAANFSVLGASTVTNTNATELEQNLGLWPGTSITGFPPGVVLAPSTIENSTAVAETAQSDLTAAYLEAEARPVNTITPADLGGLILPGGVYATTGKGALSVTGSLVLDGAGDPTSVFIFQTDTTLTTAVQSTVSLINGAQECNVFWQVGSSATLGTSSVFTGSVMALASVTVNSGAVVHGRTLARTAAVTLDGDTFVAPTCATTLEATTTTVSAPVTTTTLAPVTTTTLAPTTTTTLVPTTLVPTTLVPTTLVPTTTTTTPAPTTTTTTPSATTTTSVDQAAPAQPTGSVARATVLGSKGPDIEATTTIGPRASVPGRGASQQLPRTGGTFSPQLVLAIMGGMVIALALERRSLHVRSATVPVDRTRSSPVLRSLRRP